MRAATSTAAAPRPALVQILRSVTATVEFARDSLSRLTQVGSKRTGGFRLTGIEYLRRLGVARSNGRVTRQPVGLLRDRDDPTSGDMSRGAVAVGVCRFGQGIQICDL